MLWALISLFFFWLVFRELTGRLPISKGYLATSLFLALLFAWPPFHRWRFERFLTEVASQLAENHPAKVHCNTLFDTIFDEEPGVYGHADPKTGYIVIQYPKCSLLMDYVSHPERATLDEIIALNILTHESMHARGEYNEAKTECEAVQRNYRTAILLGVPDNIAKQNALDYYKDVYLKRRDGYFSKECAPGKAMDEHLSDSTWNE
ncbi:hypothetical protein [Legionella tucsonensis]|uniref:Uncharacterized protein n=1 Tax=Legionella tucsonensis TaxID=40335 RepID=A0A0W0ZYE3_9GAMM|nr:hypothetical protein [Legionella tucsonensis]KTD74127.1 hypothetical protein Ltuc_1974 [Legionella tucsonensis]